MYLLKTNKFVPAGTVVELWLVYKIKPAQKGLWHQTEGQLIHHGEVLA